VNEHDDGPTDWERDLLAHIAAQRMAARIGDEIRTNEARVRAVLEKLSDAQLIDSARRVAASHGPLAVLISVLLNRFENHLIMSAQELSEARATVERLAKRKATE
jgi:hypothetical protein